ncbi:hypothetical protein TPE_0814 [Treponema pedis str. T A4]|uniref:Uncharacterized protein n=1 Tax=Treponema pedis str. T A4 TaxID=1291379 RepID=S5ZT62_9SPIR|nr:hypothetical protein TPE_0814 [Treponema pedis str. T A4]
MNFPQYLQNIPVHPFVIRRFCRQLTGGRHYVLKAIEILKNLC